MKNLLFVSVLLLCCCGQSKKYHDEKSAPETPASVALQAILEYQQAKNKEFSNPETSPLPDRYRKNFEGLAFFPADTTYIVNAKLERTPEAKPFLMASTTNEKSQEVVYGIVHFKLNGVQHSLEVYQGIALRTQEGYEDYLFLPFLDLTNGDETYGGGRYIDLRIPKGEMLEIDFNRAYNPYCVYNKKYSCPLVPRQNFLNTKVMAGVKDFIAK